MHETSEEMKEVGIMQGRFYDYKAFGSAGTSFQGKNVRVSIDNQQEK